MIEEPKETVWENIKDSVYLHSFIDEFANVAIKRDKLFSGFIHCIDPVSKSIILKVPHEDDFTTVFIPGHAVISVAITPTNNKKPTRKPIQQLSEDECSKRKDKVVAWLKKNLLPVRVEGDKIILGEVSILPPYSENDFCTLNPIVAINVRRILANMPKELNII